MISIITRGRLKEPVNLTVQQVTTTYQDSDYIKLQTVDVSILQLTKPELPILTLQKIEGREANLL